MTSFIICSFQHTDPAPKYCMVFGAIVMVLFKKRLLQFPIIYYQYTAFGWIFCIVTLYPMILLCLFISTISCFVDFGGIFCADNLICEWCCFSLSNLWAFYLFIFGLIVLPEASITMLKEMVRVDGHPCFRSFFVLHLRVSLH